jgi:hypothetical protein
MIYRAKVALCSEINTKHINTVWPERKVFRRIRKICGERLLASTCLSVFVCLCVPSSIRIEQLGFH